MSKRTVLHMVLVVAAAIIAMLLIRLHSAHGQGLDPHAIYEQKCAGCHAAHGGDFARQSLKSVAAKTYGKRTGRALADILKGHKGTSLSAEETKALLDHFAAILKTGFLYQEKCLTCHVRAVDLARTWLIEKDGRVLHRFDGRNIATFLENHGRLNAEEKEAIVVMLRRQLQTGGS